MHAAGIGPGDEVIVPALTFAATANAVLYAQGLPVFADVDADSLLVDPADVARKITPRTKAIVAVDYAGQTCDYAALRDLAQAHDLILIADACHSFGGQFRGQNVGRLADLTCCSMHPVKPITSGEGGFVATHSEVFAEQMRAFRNHGIDSDFRQREAAGRWKYAMTELGFNYRLSDLQCALARSQLKKLDQWIAARRHWARQYDLRLASLDFVQPLSRRATEEHAFHLYVVRWKESLVGVNRDAALAALRRLGIGANVHYLPVYLHPYYQGLGYPEGLCPAAEHTYGEIISLPIFPGMTEALLDEVVNGLRGCANRSQAA
jgi:perosamine synthetase